jgi:hypothetical protein
MIFKSYIKNISKLVGILMSTSFFLLCCSQKQFQNESLLKGSIVVYNLPGVLPTGELINAKDSFQVFSQDDIYYYLFPQKITYENDSAVYKTEIKYSIFFFKKNNLTGEFIDQPSRIRKTYSVDSFLKKRAFLGFNYLDKKNDSLIETNLVTDSFKLIEKYVSLIKIDNSYPDTTIMYYDVQNNSTSVYSFSPLIEKNKRLKIIKIRMIYNSQYYAGYEFKFPYHEFFFEMRNSIIEKDSLIYWLKVK